MSKPKIARRTWPENTGFPECCGQPMKFTERIEGVPNFACSVSPDVCESLINTGDPATCVGCPSWGRGCKCWELGGRVVRYPPHDCPARKNIESEVARLAR